MVGNSEHERDDARDFILDLDLDRDCVIRERHNDLLGRPIYTALDCEGRELERMVAVSPEQTRKVVERLWDMVYRARVDRLHIVR